jgi:Fe-S cluster assembly iron-binding protein IscA
MAVLRRVTNHPTLAETSGLRIARPDRSGAPLQVRTVYAPEPGDGVVERDGARLILGPGAARRLTGHTLDAVSDEEGRVQFVLEAAA